MINLILSLLLIASAAFPGTTIRDQSLPNDLNLVGTLDVGEITEGASATLSNDISGNSATATALAANGANCPADQANLGVDASGAAEGCFAVPTETEFTTHTGNVSAHHVATANTDAESKCAGTNVYLDGEGNCDTISGAAAIQWVLHSSQTFSGAASATVGLTGTSSGTFRASFRGFAHGAGGNSRLFYRYNGDSGNNYRSVFEGRTTPSASEVASAEASASRCYITRDSDTAMDDSPFISSFEFFGDPTDNTKVVGFGRAFTREVAPTTTAGSFITFYTGCFYDGSAEVTSLTVHAQAGVMDGFITVLKLAN